MDLTGQAELKTSYAADGDNLVLTFKDTDDNVLGTLTIEADRFRSLTEPLDELARLLSPDGLERAQQRSEINVKQQLITTEFE